MQLQVHGGVLRDEVGGRRVLQGINLVAQLGRLEDETVHRQVGDAVPGLVQTFETEQMAP